MYSSSGNRQGARVAASLNPSRPLERWRGLMPEPDLLKTGIKGLDEVLFGGVPRGNIILVAGTAGTGKTTLGVEFVYRGAREFNEPGVIVLFEVAPDKLIRDAAFFGWDLRELERDGRRPSARGVRRRHDPPAQHRTSPARRPAVTRGREVARPRVRPGTSLVPDRQRSGARGLSSRSGAPWRAPRRRRRVRPSLAGCDGHPRPRRGGKRGVFRREHDARRRDLGRGQERHGPAVHRRRGPAR